MFDEVTILVADNASKDSLFSSNERMDLIKEIINDKFPNVKVDSTTGLTAEYAKKHQADFIVRSLRNSSDYDSEISMALINRKLSNIETIFLPASQEEQHITSSNVKEVARHQGNLKNLVPESVAKALIEKFA